MESPHCGEKSHFHLRSLQLSNTNKFHATEINAAIFTSSQVSTPAFELFRCTAVVDLPCVDVPRALEPVVFASISTCTLHATVQTLDVLSLSPLWPVSKLDCIALAAALESFSETSACC